MTARASSPDRVPLHGLEVAPSQSWGGVRLVPLLRQEIRGDLRLGKRSYQDDPTAGSLGGEAGIQPCAYVPHGLVVSWSNDGSAVAAFGTQLEARDGRRLDEARTVRVAHRMAHRLSDRRLRLVPLHLALEGFLALHFKGPEVAWSEYSQRAISVGLAPRTEDGVRGGGIPGFEDALRVFELHDRQVGVLVFVADALASAFVVPHPDDYALLHRTLLEDCYGALLAHAGLHAAPSRMEAAIDATQVSSLADLRDALAGMRAEWRAAHHGMAEGLFGRPVRSERLRRAGPFLLQRFTPDFAPGEENHLGEAIVRDTGELEYLKTFRLSAAQCRRAFLLSQLAAQRWNLEATAALLRQSKADLVCRLEKAGFGYLLKDHVLQAARRRR